MGDFTIKTIDEMRGAFGGGFKLARAELGVTSFGMQVIDMPAGYADYPEHTDEEQEEVFVPLARLRRDYPRRREPRSRRRNDDPRRSQREPKDHAGPRRHPDPRPGCLSRQGLRGQPGHRAGGARRLAEEVLGARSPQGGRAGAVLGGDEPPEAAHQHHGLAARPSFGPGRPPRPASRPPRSRWP